LITARLVTPLGGAPRWRLSGTVRGVDGAPPVEVSGGRLATSAPAVLVPETLRPYLAEWARSRGWELAAVTLDATSYPPALTCDVWRS
jgi:hypothetical protein